MTDTPHPVRLESLKIADLLGDSQLAIPEYQRIYCWDTTDITQFWESIRELDGIHLGTVILYENGEEKEIVDGQQRLLTVSLMLHLLSEKLPPDPRVPSLALLQRKTGNKEEIQNIANAKWIINDLFSKLNEKEKIKERNKILAIQVTKISILQGHPDLAYVFFNNQNSKGEKLTDFDLLKAHHLRFIKVEEEAKEVAQDWAGMHGKIAKRRGEKAALHHALGFLVYRLRKLVRHQEFNEDGHYIRDEFKSIPLPEHISRKRGQTLKGKTARKIRKKQQAEFKYHSPLQGGKDFFNFARYFYDKYQIFECTDAADYLLNFSTRHRYFHEMAECLLFAYYLKFGKQYLAEALFCICAVLGQYRYGMPKATRAVYEMALDSELIHLIDQAPSPAFFLGQASEKLKTIPSALAQWKPSADKTDPEEAGASERPIFSLHDVRDAVKNKKRNIRTDYYTILCKICDELKDHFKVDAIKRLIDDNYRLRKKQND